MTRERFSHAECAHPSTKAGRAGCRKQMRDAAMGKTTESAAKAAAPKPGTAKKDPRKAAPVVAVETTESAPAENADAAAVETPAAEVTREINADTWREHKDKAANVYINGVAEPFAAQCITGWSIKFLQFTDSEGKRQRIPASTVERVTV